MSLGKKMLISVSITLVLGLIVVLTIGPGVLQSCLLGLSVFMSFIITNQLAKRENT